MMYYNSKTGELTSEKPGGNHYYDPDTYKTMFADWQEKDDSFTPPANTTKQKALELNKLMASFNAKLTDLQGRMCVAATTGNETLVTTIKAQIDTETANYKTQRSAIING